MNADTTIPTTTLSRSQREPSSPAEPQGPVPAPCPQGGIPRPAPQPPQLGGGAGESRVARSARYSAIECVCWDYETPDVVCTCGASL
jgi:hypothetical protein